MNEDQIQHVLNGLRQIEHDDRLGYSVATVIENAPLALIQATLKEKASGIRWTMNALGLGDRLPEQPKFHGK